MGVYTMNADGRGSQLEAEGFLIHNDTLSWSRDGNRIAVAPVRLLKNGFGSDIVVMNANGANGMNLTDDPPARNINPSWSPGGKKIAYVASPDPFRWWPPHNVHVMNADGTNPVMLTKEDRWAYEWNPTWSPDSKKIAFVKQTPDGFHNIFTMNADGSGLSNITQTHRIGEGSPAWSPAPQAVSSRARLITQWGDVKQGTGLQQRVHSED
jgi:Tol biopolymer transport system component